MMENHIVIRNHVCLYQQDYKGDNMMALSSVFGKFIGSILRMDYIGYTDNGDTVTYRYKTSIISPSTAEIKAKIQSIADFPPDIPLDVKITKLKDRPLIKDAIIEITVSKEGIGKVSNLFARKYGIIRERDYER